MVLLTLFVLYSGFNFFGLSVTRTVSATSRSTIDTCRTLFIWVVSLGLRWESFKWLQILGFALLVYSTFLFNGIVQPPFEFLRIDGETEELLPRSQSNTSRLLDALLATFAYPTLTNAGLCLIFV